MRTIGKIFLLITLFALVSCGDSSKNNIILSQTFDATGWEKFSPVYSDVEVTRPVTYDLSLKVAFSENYSNRDFDVVFTVFDASDMPMRAKAYSFRLKDNDGNWKSEKKDGVYEFDFPINKSLSITDSGKYRFQIDSRMPITPLLGIVKLELINNQ